jgi:hypothetical protein
MELFEEGFEEQALPKLVRAVVGVSAIASTGFILLNSRSVYWLISALTSRPLWKGFDPLEVIFAWEQEQEEERKKGNRPHPWSRRRDRDEESLQSLIVGDRMDVRELEEAVK